MTTTDTGYFRIEIHTPTNVFVSRRIGGTSKAVVAQLNELERIIGQGSAYRMESDEGFVIIGAPVMKQSVVLLNYD